MQKELIEKANELIRRIEEDERAVWVLSRHAKTKKELTLKTEEYCHDEQVHYPEPIKFETQEIRRIIRQKKRRIAELKEELERL